MFFKKSFKRFTCKILNRFFVCATPKKRKNSDEKKNEKEKHRYVPDSQQPTADESIPSTSTGTPTTITISEEYVKYYTSKDFKPSSSATPSNPPVTVKSQTQKRKSTISTPKIKRKQVRFSSKQETSHFSFDNKSNKSDITQTLPTTTGIYNLFNTIKAKYFNNQYFQHLSNINTADISSGITINGIKYSIEFKKDLDELLNNTIAIYHTLDFQKKQLRMHLLGKNIKICQKKNF